MTTAARPVVGFVGVGRIGTPLVERLAAAGHPLVLHDLRPGATAPFAGRATVARDAAEVADRADIVLACLMTDDDYRAAVLGERGIVRGARAKLYAHLGTTGHASVAALAAALAERGIVTVDAPVSGGVAGARAGTLVTLLAGPDDAVARIEALAAAWSRRIVKLGTAPGVAQTMKLLNNLLSAANLVVACEVMVVGRKAGLPTAAMLDALNHGTGQNSATLTKIPDQVATRRFQVGSTLANGIKDLSNYAELARELGVDSAFAATLLAQFRRAIDEGDAQDDFGTVIRPLERAAGVEVGPDE